jgi:hypothetical protein
MTAITSVRVAVAVILLVFVLTYEVEAFHSKINFRNTHIGGNLHAVRGSRSGSSLQLAEDADDNISTLTATAVGKAARTASCVAAVTASITFGYASIVSAIDDTAIEALQRLHGHQSQTPDNAVWAFLIIVTLKGYFDSFKSMANW